MLTHDLRTSALTWKPSSCTYKAILRDYGCPQVPKLFWLQNFMPFSAFSTSRETGFGPSRNGDRGHLWLLPTSPSAVAHSTSSPTPRQTGPRSTVTDMCMLVRSVLRG